MSERFLYCKPDKKITSQQESPMPQADSKTPFFYLAVQRYAHHLRADKIGLSSGLIISVFAPGRGIHIVLPTRYPQRLMPYPSSHQDFYCPAMDYLLTAG
jgi:hypothetical protein